MREFRSLWVEYLHRIGLRQTHVLLVALYVLTVTPIALIRKTLGSSIFGLLPDALSSSYWRLPEGRPATLEDFRRMY